MDLHIAEVSILRNSSMIFPKPINSFLKVEISIAPPLLRSEERGKWGGSRRVTSMMFEDELHFGCYKDTSPRLFPYVETLIWSE